MTLKKNGFNCPHCGAPVLAGALACRECGSDARTGWSEGADVWAADIPPDPDDFDYDEYLRREFSDNGNEQTRSKIVELFCNRSMNDLAIAIMTSILGLALVYLFLLLW